MIQVGKRCYFEQAPWLLNQAGALEPQACDVSAYVPAEAVAFSISTVLFRTWSDQWGNVDVSAVLRLPGHTNTDYMVAACEVESGRAGNSNCREGGGYGQIILPVLPLPAGGRGFYWLIRGAQSCLNVGVNVSIALHWYELP